MKKLNKSKLNEVSKSFTKGFKASLTDKACIVGSAFVGGLKSEGKLTTGLYEGAKILVQASVVNGISHIVIDQVFNSEDEVKED